MKKCNRRKPCNANNSVETKGQLSLMQCGFSKLLQREVETTKEEDNNYNSHHSSSDDQTLRTNVNGKHSDSQECQSHVSVLEHGNTDHSPDRTDKQNLHSINWLVLSSSEEEGDIESDNQGISKHSDTVMNTENSSEDDDDDVIFPTQVSACQQSLLTKKVKLCRSTSENCEELTKEKDGVVFKEDSRQFGFHNSESNFSKTVSFEDIKNCTRELKGASDVSDESDDIEISHNSKSRKSRTFSFPKWKERYTHNNGQGNVSKPQLQAKKPNREEKESDSQNIDEFSSSEDNLPVEKTHARKQSCKRKNQRGRVWFGSKILYPIQDTSVAQMKSSNYAVCRTSASKTEFEHQEQKVESMDRYLGNF